MFFIGHGGKKIKNDLRLMKLLENQYKTLEFLVRRYDSVIVTTKQLQKIKFYAININENNSYDKRIAN